jgi:hypothetical protein
MSSGIADIVLNPGETAVVTPKEHTKIIYTGAASTTAYVQINATVFQVANESGAFVWDADNAQGSRHTFTVVGEKILSLAGSLWFEVIWNGFDGFGNILFTLRFIQNINKINGVPLYRIS